MHGCHSSEVEHKRRGSEVEHKRRGSDSPTTTLWSSGAMDYFSNAIQKAQASVDQALGIDEGIANEAMGTSHFPICVSMRAYSVDEGIANTTKGTSHDFPASVCLCVSAVCARVCYFGRGTGGALTCKALRALAAPDSRVVLVVTWLCVTIGGCV